MPRYDTPDWAFDSDVAAAGMPGIDDSIPGLDDIQSCSGSGSGSGSGGASQILLRRSGRF